ncbi:hypothetical protein [Paenibacillus sp. FSL R5-0486]|uniref:phage adaptor protein n=1 Tax=Paenibacillus sp. FSL R5-0486 TaxID=2921645 RepID=UPI0030DC06D6
MIASDLLADINLRYRNTFTEAQKLVWMNDEQNDIFQSFKIESDPVPVPLVTGSKLYLRPPEIKYIEQVRAATMQLNSSGNDPAFVDLPFRRNMNDVGANFAPWYTFLGSDKMYINLPNTDMTDCIAYFFIDAYATPITAGTSVLSLPDKYMEIMKYGVLRRIAEARKDIVMVNNYTGSRDEIIDNMLWTEVTNEPEWVVPTSTQKFRSHSNGYIINGY